MKKFFIIAILALSIGITYTLCFRFTQSQTNKKSWHRKGAIPSWVKPYDLPLEATSIKPSGNIQYLLIDKQWNCEDKTLYNHFAIQALTISGIEKISQLKIDFDPSYNKVVVHTIRVCREGEWLDRLVNARPKLIQREQDLEKNIYNGKISLVYFLEDIREGDLLEYSYSLTGTPPHLSSHYTDRVILQKEFPVRKIAYRFLGHPDHSFLIKPFNTEIEPKIYDLSPSLREWCWEASNTLPYEHKKNQPRWYNPLARIEISQYKNWEEVAEKFYPYFILPSDFSQSIPLEMQTLVDQWKTSTNEPSERALLALRFVQDQVGYFGIEEGISAFIPTNPNLTFQRRFGDCKDKTFLLHSLLQRMDIPSTPLLVHSRQGKRLPEILPSPSAFNHLVLQLEIDGASYYVDPTLSFQGGALQTNRFPNYEWGLLLSKDSSGLIPLPKDSYKNPIEIDSSYIFESEDAALLRIKSVFNGFGADQMRRSFERLGLESREKTSLSCLQKVHGAVTLVAPVTVQDDRENNTLTIFESYRVPTQEFPGRKELNIFSYTLRNYLDHIINPEISSLYSIKFPLWVKERIHIKNPFTNWELFEEDITKTNESIFYTLSSKREGKNARFEFELKHLQDHIHQSSLQNYCALVKEIDRKAPHKVIISSAIPAQENSATDI